jgi:hypothetical protein
MPPDNSGRERCWQIGDSHLGGGERGIFGLGFLKVLLVSRT